MTRLTDEEKEVLYVYGSPILKDTHKRLGMACSQAYFHLYASVREELSDLLYKGEVA